MPPTESVKALIVVRTYPVPASPGIEVSCTAAISEDGRWLRLYPIPYRFLEPDKRFRKYQWIQVEIRKGSDVRLESYHPNLDSIEVLTEPLSTRNRWQDRKSVTSPKLSHCLCCLKEQRNEAGYPTLGFFRPRRIERLRIIATDSEWTQGQLDILSQRDLFRENPKEELEKIPYNFVYNFYCDHDECRGHNCMCTDWEIGESWRSWSREYGDDWEKALRETYETKMIENRDTHFFVGTVANHPGEWIIVGLFYPPKDYEMPLFDSINSDEG
jgi:hypothetical protein